MTHLSRTYSPRWFAYFDLLGFTNRVRNEHIDEIIDLYEVITDILEKDSKLKLRGITKSWFSDTFIISSRYDTNDEYRVIEAISFQFFERLILQGVPVTGAVTYGNMYTNAERNQYIGEALIDAYKYGDNTNFIGLVKTPQLIQELEQRGFATANGRKFVPVPFYSPYKDLKINSSDVLIYKSDIEVNGDNCIRDTLVRMKNEAPEQAKIKYDNALRVYTQ
jgi:hypothetical protein